MNVTQVMSMITPLIVSAAAWLATQVPLLDQATWNMLITAIAVAVVTAVLGYLNRSLALKDTVGHMAQTTVVTDPVSANALPKNPDVMAVTPKIAAAINEAKAKP